METIGWIGSCFVLISFIPKDIKTIRIINGLGCLLWVAYGIINKAPSVLAMNAFILVFHIIHLIKIVKNNKVSP